MTNPHDPIPDVRNDPVPEPAYPDPPADPGDAPPSPDADDGSEPPHEENV